MTGHLVILIFTPDPVIKLDVYTDPYIAAERAAEYVERGFTALRFGPAGVYTIYDGRQPRMEDLNRSEQFVKQLREAVGIRADLLFGTHGQFTASGAIRLARVARQTTVPIATGERLTTKYEFARILEHQAASIVQFALGRVGDILEAKKIAGIAETYYAQIAPHLCCGPIEGAANIQIATCSPNFLILESIQDWGGIS